MDIIPWVVREVQEEIQNQSFSVQRMIDLMNDCQRLVAAGRFPQYPEVQEIYLPDLEVTDTITTAADDNKIALSSLSTYTYQKLLTRCYSVSQGRTIKVAESFNYVQRYLGGRESDSGTIYAVCARGSTLWYGYRAAENLRLTFFREPDTLTIDSTATNIPEPFGRNLLKSYVLMQLPKQYRAERAISPADEFRMNLANLSAFIGTYETPPIHTEDGYVSYLNEVFNGYR